MRCDYYKPHGTSDRKVPRVVQSVRNPLKFPHELAEQLSGEIKSFTTLRCSSHGRGNTVTGQKDYTGKGLNSYTNAQLIQVVISLSEPKSI
jgi:hypothetical protein